MRNNHITINLEDNEYKMIENLAAKDKRKIADFTYLKLLDGLYRCDNSVYKLDDIARMLDDDLYDDMDLDKIRIYLNYSGARIYNKKTLILFIDALIATLIEINNSYVLNNIKDAFIKELKLNLSMKDDPYDN